MLALYARAFPAGIFGSAMSDLRRSIGENCSLVDSGGLLVSHSCINYGDFYVRVRSRVRASAFASRARKRRTG